jgi:hypothetical protein
MLIRCGQVVAACGLLTLLCGSIAQGQNSSAESSALARELFGNGIQVAGTGVPLAPPLLAGQTDQEQRRQLLEKLSEKHGWEKFSRNSITAPVFIEMGSVTDANGQRLGHNVYCAYIAYAKLESLKDQRLMESLFGEEQQPDQAAVEAAEIPKTLLQSVGALKDSDAGASFSKLKLPLMNRVEIEGTVRLEKVVTPESTLLVWQLDPRFAPPIDGQTKVPDLKGFENLSFKLARDDLGNLTRQTGQPYAGCGGLISAQQTGLAQNQLLVESRLVICEPSDWFSGSNFLRSKFPTLLQESAQTFRRKLAKH